jgi:hypothetical protein
MGLMTSSTSSCNGMDLEWKYLIYVLYNLNFTESITYLSISTYIHK